MAAAFLPSPPQEESHTLRISYFVASASLSEKKALIRWLIKVSAVLLLCLSSSPFSLSDVPAFSCFQLFSILSALISSELLYFSLLYVEAVLWLSVSTFIYLCPLLMLLCLFSLYTHKYKTLSLLSRDGENCISFFFCPKMSPCRFIHTHWPLLKCHGCRKGLWLKMQPSILSLSTCKYLLQEMEDNYNVQGAPAFMCISSSAQDDPPPWEKGFSLDFLTFIDNSAWNMGDKMNQSHPGTLYSIFFV